MKARDLAAAALGGAALGLLLLYESRRPARPRTGTARRAAQNGASATLTTASMLFQHANVQLPDGADRAMSAAMVTPRMHATHHSNLPELRATNFGNLTSIWDRAHRTLETHVPAEAITIGVRPGEAI